MVFFSHLKNKKQPSRGDFIGTEEKYGGVGLMLRGRDARAADARRRLQDGLGGRAQGANAAAQKG